MSLPIPDDTRIAIGANDNGTEFRHCDSRSLVLERFADPTLEKDRRNFFKHGIGKPALPYKRDAWRDFLLTGLGLKPEDLLFAKLQARLMINMAGGVMENAGLCLDRLTGIPCIPGSAVKGCARRFAIQRLLETTSDQQVALLTDIALVFGWSDLEWKTRVDLKPRPRPNETDDQFRKRWQGIWEKNRSDFAFACGDDGWPKVSGEVMLKLAGHLHLPIKRDKRERIELPSYAGDIQFLLAYPFGTPPDPDLELDVVTCHHQKYYACDRAIPVALDTEEPIPVIFPAVAPGHVFVFAVWGDDQARRDKAKDWLQEGLESFGLGAKVAAGYGWFEVQQTTPTYRQKLQEIAQHHEAAQKRQQLQPDPKLIEELSAKKEDQLRGIVNQFQFEEKLWPKDRDEVFQLSLLVFCTETNPGLYQNEKANAKSKIVKALLNLARKFGRSLP